MEIKAAKVLRRKLEKRYRKTRLTIDLELYRCQRNRVHALREQAKQSYFMDKIATSEQKDLQKLLDQLLHKDRNSSAWPTKFPQDDLADTFADYFCEKIDIIRNSIPQVQGVSVDMSDDAISPSAPLTNLRCLTDNEVLKLVQKSPTKTCSLDPLPTWLLKDIKGSMVPVLTNLINSSLSSGTVPPMMKEAIVTPILKKPTLDVELLKNFRPVSNLPFVSKLTERAVAAQYLEHCEKSGLRNDFQSAYKQHNSTETALTRVNSDILQAVDKDGAAILVLLDLSAAFDTIEHSLLLHTLENDMMVSGTALKWFKSYLSGRTQTVLAKGSTSSSRALNCGVPQGSVLGPILFTTYTRPLGKIIASALLMYMLYADDSQLYISFKPRDPASLHNAVTAVTSCVASIQAWMANHYLKLNAEKTEVLVITTPSLSQSVTLPSLHLAGADVQTKEVVRDLGVTLDSRLQLEQHVVHTAKSAYAYLHKVARIRRYLTADAAKTLVHSLIISRLDYCNVLLFGLPDCLLHKLQRVQNHAARVISGTKKYEHISPVLQSLHWLPIEQRIIYKTLLLTFKSLNGLAPSYLCDLLKPYSPCRSLRSSNQNLLQEPSYRLKTYGARSFECAAPRLWNNLPANIRSVSCLTTFKRCLKTVLFKEAYNV